MRSERERETDDSNDLLEIDEDKASGAVANNVI